MATTDHYEPPREAVDKVAKRLAALATTGLHEWAVGERAGTMLLRMQCVKERTNRGKTPAQALIEVISEEVDAIRDLPHGVLLGTVLGLDGSLEMSALERQEAAGQQFRPGKPAGAATIRKHHLPRALVRLARRLLIREHAAQERGSN